MKVTEGTVVVESEYRTQVPRIYWSASPRPEAQFAMQLIERWGMVAGIPEGEDSAGRAKIGLMAPKDVVARAIETTELAFLAMDEKGWFIQVPPPKIDPKD